MAEISGLIQRVGRWCATRSEKLLHKARHWRDADWCKGSADVFTLLAATKRFIRNDVPVLLELDQDMPVHIELPISGSQSLTTVLTAADKKVVLRVYPLVNTATARAHAMGAELLASHNVNVPRVRFASVDDPKYGAVFIMEEFVEGESRHASDLTSANIAALASQLARMHSVRNPRWGRVMIERDDPLFLPLSQRVKRDLETLHNQNVINHAEARRVQEWVSQWKAEFDSVRSYSLTHNDLQPANAIFTANGDYYLIDLNRLQWGPAAREVVQCYHRQLGSNPEMIAEFDKTYYAALAPEDALEIRTFCQFYEVFHRISTLLKRVVKSRKHPEVQAHNEERQKVLLEELMALVDNSREAA